MRQRRWLIPMVTAYRITLISVPDLMTQLMQTMTIYLMGVTT